jgi:hypothetical protein
MEFIVKQNRKDRSPSDWWISWCPSLLAMLACIIVAGCGSGAPFELAQVDGTVTYEDGSLIQADQLLVKFFPQGIAIKGKDAPRAAETYAEVSDGSFRKLTTWNYADGVMVGHHKVVVISMKVGSHGVGEPTKAVAAIYNQIESTPLDVEVTSGSNHFDLKIKKP